MKGIPGRRRVGVAAPADPAPEVAPGPDAEVDRLRADNRRLRERNDRLINRSGDNPALSYLFVLTYGRSGSTLISGVLNAIPGYLIRGENRDAVYHLYRYHHTLEVESNVVVRSSYRTPTHPFYGISDVPLAKSTSGIRELVLQTLMRPLHDTRVTGFKEIRWYQPDLADYVAWLAQTFPGARFLINTRAHAPMLASGWWAEGDLEENAATLAANEAQLLGRLEPLGEAAFRVHYDDYVADPTRLRGLFDWLGEEWDEDRVRATFAVRHSI